VNPIAEAHRYLVPASKIVDDDPPTYIAVNFTQRFVAVVSK
jgi:hypothetical protein